MVLVFYAFWLLLPSSARVLISFALGFSSSRSHLCRDLPRSPFISFRCLIPNTSNSLCLPSKIIRLLPLLVMTAEDLECS